jgi:hypothetical protein
MNQGKLFEQILNPANRHNPYPLYAQLRETPISQQEDGTYVVSTYRDRSPLVRSTRQFRRTQEYNLSHNNLPSSYYADVLVFSSCRLD